ncbi:TPA: hypothetical protein ACGOZ1_000670 [Streptococcus suis]
MYQSSSNDYMIATTAERIILRTDLNQGVGQEIVVDKENILISKS